MDIEYISEERAIRSEMIEIIRRACNQGLMILTYGTISVRWKGNDFLITPSKSARWDIVPSDIVQIKNGMAEAGKTPSRSVALHQRIYQLNPHVNSVPSIHFGLIYNVVDSVAKMFKKNRAVLVENDSVYITGNKLMNSFDHLEVAEFSAKLFSNGYFNWHITTYR